MVANIFHPGLAREDARMAGIDLGDLTDEDLIEAHEVARDEANALYEGAYEEDDVVEAPGWWMADPDDEPPF